MTRRQLPPTQAELDRRNSAIAKLDAIAALVRCADCGVVGRWVGSTVVNAGTDPAPPTCPGHRRPRQHGTWLSVGPASATVAHALQAAAAENA